jgi:hypothetical protein
VLSPYKKRIILGIGIAVARQPEVKSFLEKKSQHWLEIEELFC